MLALSFPGSRPARASRGPWRRGAASSRPGPARPRRRLSPWPRAGVWASGRRRAVPSPRPPARGPRPAARSPPRRGPSQPSQPSRSPARRRGLARPSRPSRRAPGAAAPQPGPAELAAPVAPRRPVAESALRAARLRSGLLCYAVYDKSPFTKHTFALTLVDSQTIKTLLRSAKVAMKQPNRKRKLNMDSKEHLNQDGCLEQAEEEKKPMDDATPLSHDPSVAAQEAWSWEQYLTEQKAIAAPVELFSKDQSFPEHENGFQVGMRLEGIDPRHPSVFCVLSVAEVCGYRLRLHFDGYLSCYDFWTNAGSPDIHPIGWCEKTKHELHIPKGYRKDKFVWMDYLKACKLQNAPKKLFRNRSSNGPMPKEFQVGMKLEAIDRKNPSLVCVATIADIVEDRLLVHFDNWDDSYDYWCDVNSPYVQPVGWCQENGRTLIAPQGYPDPENFSWTEYLEATQTNAVPAKVFKMRPPHGFLPSMRLEAVDRRNPRLIRVATVIDVDDQRVKVHFDGWDHKYDYWMDADSPDIHPIGWCDVTGHPLEVPYRANDVKILPGQAVCPTPGCRGIGHIRGPRYSGHHSAFGCPYSDMNLKKEATLHDRLREQTQAHLESDSSHSKSKNLCSLSFNGKHEKVNSQPRLVQQAKCLKIKGKEDIDLDNLFREYSAEQTQQALHQSVFMSSVSAHPFRDLPLGREQHCKLLPGVANIQAGEVARWTVEEVAEFVQSLLGCEEHAKCFKKEQIDGKAFLLLTQTDIVKVMKIKLGPALKIYNSILMFRNSQDLSGEDSLSGQEARG